MPYSLRGDQPGCPGWAVVNTATGKTVPGGCHPDRAAAARHLKALRADVPAQDLALTVSYTDAPGGTMQIGASELEEITAEVMAMTHEKVGHTQQGLWHHKGMQLPAFIQHIANDLIHERGMPESQAIATAISQCKKWAAGGEGVKPETRAKAAAAIAEWERLKAQSKLTKGAAAEDAPALPQLVTIPGVDILAAGTWQLSTGRQTFTRDDLAAAVEASQCPAVGPPVIKIGHLDQRFTPAPQASETDGEPAIGKVANLRLNEGGTKIVGDLAGMPGWLGAIAASAYPRRSVEGKFRFACQIGHTHPFVLTGLALLGVTPPGVGVLNGLDDVASLYGLTAATAGEAWRTEPQDQEEPVMPVTEEDVRRAYYATASPPQSWWITELQMQPTQLIVADEGTGKLYRVPFSIDTDQVEFGSPDEMASYDDVAASRGTGPVMVYASAGDSRSVMAAWDGAAAVRAMGDDPSASAIKAMFALPGDTKTDSSLPHHDCSGGKVGAANPDACSAAIAALNGARGGLKGVSEGQKRAAYSHLAAHLKAAGRTPPDFTGSAGDPGEEQDEELPVEAAGNHGPHTGEHTHPHSAMGDQGGDATHEHAHRHDNDAVHDHAHAPVSAAPAASKEGVRTVDFTDEQLAAIRAKLGKQPGEEVTPADIAAAFAAPAAPVAASAAGGEAIEVPAITEGTYLVDGDILKQYQERALAGDRAVHAMAVAERDTVLAAAVSDGKFAQARLDHFRRLWDRDPDGTRKLVGSLASGLVPMNPVGSAGEFGVDPDLPGDFAGQDAYRKLYPDDLKGGSSPAPGVRAGRGF